jgi:hypothetical protein
MPAQKTTEQILSFSTEVKKTGQGGVLGKVT